jgi:hypothetical protein
MRLSRIDVWVWLTGKFLFFVCFFWTPIVLFYLIVMYFFQTDLILIAIAIFVLLIFYYDSRFVARTTLDKWKESPLSKLPHPIVVSIKPGDTDAVKLLKRKAIMKLETKAYSLCAAICVVLTYFVFLLINSSQISGDQSFYQAILFGLSYLCPWFISDFFDVVDVNRFTEFSKLPLMVRLISYITQLVLVYCAIRAVLQIMNLRRKYGSVLRSAALTKVEAEIEKKQLLQ